MSAFEDAPIEISTIRIRQTAAGHHIEARGRSKANTALAVALGLLLLLSPLPLGGNRPFFLGASAALTAAIGLVYAIWLSRAGQRLRLGFLQLPEVALPFLLTLAYLAVQLAPIGGTVTTALGAVLPRPGLSIDPGSTALTLIQMAGYGLVFMFAAQVGARTDRAGTMLMFLFGAIVAYAVVGLVSLTELGDTLLGMQKWAYQGSATGTFVNRNSYATFLAFGLVIGTAQATEILIRPINRERRKRYGFGRLVLILAGMLLVFSALLATGSRMGAFAGIVGSGCALMLGFARGGAGFRVWMLALLAVVVAGVAAVVLYGGGLLERLGSLENSGDVRGGFYAEVWQMLFANPLWGYGGGTFQEAFPLFHALPVSADVVWERAHSTYLALWTELGFVAGTLPMLAVLAIAVRTFIAYLRRQLPSGLALAAIGVIVVGAVHSIVDFSLEIQANALFFACLLGLAVGAAAVHFRPNTSAGPSPL